MRGKRAREIRKSQLPADLREQMRAEIRPLAAKREKAIKDSRRQMKIENAQSWQDHQRRTALAETDFRSKKNEIVERYEAQAEKRRGIKATEKEVASGS